MAKKNEFAATLRAHGFAKTAETNHPSIGLHHATYRQSPAYARPGEDGHSVDLYGHTKQPSHWEHTVYESTGGRRVKNGVGVADLSRHLGRTFGQNPFKKKGQDTKVTGQTAAPPPAEKKGKSHLHPLHTFPNGN
jgi:hypothetical protein